MSAWKNVRYLGDSVYADYDGHMIRLYTDNGTGPHNIVFLDPSVMAALNRYADDIWRSPAEDEALRADWELDAARDGEA